MDEASEAESHGKRWIKDKSLGRGLAIMRSLNRHRPWVSPFSVFCPQASFLHQAHHLRIIWCLLKIEMLSPKIEVLQCLLEALIYGLGVGRGAEVSFCNSGNQVGKEMPFPQSFRPTDIFHVMYNLKAPSKSRKKIFYMMLAKS